MSSSTEPRSCARLLLVCAALAPFAFACTSEAPAAQPARSAGAEKPQRTAKPLAGTRQVPPNGREPDRRAHMEESFWIAINARDALIDGDLPAARSLGHELAVHDYADAFPASWKHWVGQLQQQAGALATAADEAAAGEAIGALALACGNCHRDHEGGFRTPFAWPMAWKDPPDTLSERMERHAVGIEQMWFGLIAPADDAWKAGTVTLTRAPLEPPRQGGQPVDEKLHAGVERLREVGQQARAARTPVERAQAFGAAITSCARCHYATPFEP